jgi:hypothetical protein
MELYQQIIKEHGSIENYWAKGRKESKSYSDAVEKQGNLWKKNKEKNE